MAEVSGAERRAVESRVVQRRWRELVSAWKRSDQDERLFCERQKIGVCALRWWVRRLSGEHALRDRARPAIAKTAPAEPRRRSREQWVRFCAEWERSGVRQAEFCRQRGLNVETFRWWRSQLRASTARGVQVHPPAAVVTLPTAAPAPTFIPVTVAPAEATSPARRARGPTIDVVLRRHRRVRVGPDLDERLLARVVLVLEAIP